MVTGANKGIGFSIAEQLIASGQFGRVIIACRNIELGQGAAEKLGAEFAPLDLAEVESIDNFAKFMQDSVGRCDGLVNNGAIAFKVGGACQLMFA